MKRVRVGYDYLHVAVDDHSRVAFVCALRDEQGSTCAQFVADAAAFFAAPGVVIERVMTDNAVNYKRSKVFKAKFEEFAYKTLFTAKEQRLRAVEPWLASLQCPETSHGNRRAHPSATTP